MNRLVLPLLFCVLLPSPAASVVCLCLEYETAEQHFAETDLIFDGVPERQRSVRDRKGHNRETIFRVTHTWKGPRRSRVVVRHPFERCGAIKFLRGQTYRVYAEWGDPGFFRTNECSRPPQDGSDYETLLKRHGRRQGLRQVPAGLGLSVSTHGRE